MVAGEHGIEGREIAESLLNDLGSRIHEHSMDYRGDFSELFWATSGIRGEANTHHGPFCRKRESPRLSHRHSCSPLSRQLVSREAVSRPLITRCKTLTLKKEMNFSWESISLRAAEVDFTRHVVHNTISQSRVSRFERGRAGRPLASSSGRTSARAACRLGDGHCAKPSGASRSAGLRPCRCEAGPGQPTPPD